MTLFLSEIFFAHIITCACAYNNYVEQQYNVARLSFKCQVIDVTVTGAAEHVTTLQRMRLPPCLSHLPLYHVLL